MSAVYVAGLGAVSPAGWGVAALRGALEKGGPLPVQSLVRPGWEKPLRVRLVPPPATRPEFLAHPRLRRSSPVTHYAAAATLEALAGIRTHPDAKSFRLGLIACLQSGCVQYTCRFFDETLANPATASPLVFPETVHAAPASHIAALLENTTLAGTLVGDPSVFLEGATLGARWLAEGRVDVCVIFGAEEPNWIIADALARLDRRAISASGAGALCLCANPRISMGVELAAITDRQTYSARRGKPQAAAAMERQLFGAATPPAQAELLCDGLDGGGPRVDAPERSAFANRANPRLSAKRILGEGMMAAAAWQCVAACDAVATGKFNSACAAIVGPLQQAVGARFVRADFGLSAAGDAGRMRP